jgi:hypothetical protein
MPELVRYRNKPTQSGIFLVRYRTKVVDAGADAGISFLNADAQLWKLEGKSRANTLAVLPSHPYTQQG